MHLDLQAIINYITLGLVVLFISIALFSVITKKIKARRRKKEESYQINEYQPTYVSSNVHTYSVPGNSPTQPLPSKTVERTPSNRIRFQVVNRSVDYTSNFSSKTWH